ncbi:MAG: DUF1772 domain-containing protein [Myxococcales bacterium]|jgi:hypothetical protein
MPSRLSRILLWLLVIDLGMALGAGLFESRIVVPDWIVSVDSGVAFNADAARHDDTGRRFWVAVTTVPLTLLTLANLLVAWRATGRTRKWWLGAALIALAERIFTFSYFIPTMVRLMEAPAPQELGSEMARWAQLDYLRHAVVLAALLAALGAFSLVYEQRGSLSSQASAGSR